MTVTFAYPTGKITTKELGEGVIAEMRETQGRVYYSVNGKVSKENAWKIQTQLGYYPQGYGFYDYRIDGDTTRWHSDDTAGN